MTPAVHPLAIVPCPGACCRGDRLSACVPPAGLAGPARPRAVLVRVSKAFVEAAAAQGSGETHQRELARLDL